MALRAPRLSGCQAALFKNVAVSAIGKSDRTGSCGTALDCPSIRNSKAVPAEAQAAARANQRRRFIVIRTSPSTFRGFYPILRNSIVWPIYASASRAQVLSAGMESSHPSTSGFGSVAYSAADSPSPLGAHQRPDTGAQGDA